MSITFTKMHGMGNDFVVVDGFIESFEPTPAEVAAICDRHLGIGADGVIIVRPARQGSSAHGFMDYINADGSLAQMCGNGVRVTAKFLVDRGYADASGAVTVDTRAGVKRVDVTVGEHGRVSRARVNMGAPILAAEKVPVLATSVGGFITLSLMTPWGAVTAVAVSMGNPHAVIFLDADGLAGELFDGEPALSTLDVDTLGAYLEQHPAFPEHTNVEFAVVNADGREIDMRVFERGVGETLACGTGACATLVAACLTGRAGRSARLNLLGGQLSIDWTESGDVHKTGPASTTYEGRWPALSPATA